MSSSDVRAGKIEAEVERLLDEMTLDEKIGQMTGDTPLWKAPVEIFDYNRVAIPAGENRRLGIPPILFSDGPRGVVMEGGSCFPVAIARGATWDPELEERVGDAIGVEARALGANLFAGICINVLRHPAWGRAQETYGEDPHHLGEMGAAMVRGVQRHVMACVKHFAANSIEDSRFQVDVRVEEGVLREIYLPHFQRCIEAGAASMMSAYNRVNGVHCGHNAVLLREILKQDWGFDGFVMSDFFFGVYDAARAVRGGCDLEMPYALRFRGLRRAVQQGRVDVAQVDDAVRRILRMKLRFAAVGENERYERSAVAGSAHRALARQVAVRSLVLLQNRSVGGAPLLPIDPDRVERIAVIGRLAALENTGDVGSSRTRTRRVVTILDGLRDSLGRERIDYLEGDDVAAAVGRAHDADYTVLVAGLTHRDEGENLGVRGGDRKSLTLRSEDEDLLRAVAAATPRLAVVLMGGAPIVMESWRDRVAAILMAWYPGMEGGHAVADVLFGETEPGGRLPCTFPREPRTLPPFDPRAKVVVYDAFYGYRRLDRAGRRAAFPFGYGLGYTDWSYGSPRAARDEIAAGEEVRLLVEVSNTGARRGADVVQVYVGPEPRRPGRPRKQLGAFRRIELARDESRTVELVVPARALQRWSVAARKWVVEPGRYRICVGRDAEEAEGRSVVVRVKWDKSIRVSSRSSRSGRR